MHELTHLALPEKIESEAAYIAIAIHEALLSAAPDTYILAASENVMDEYGSRGLYNLSLHLGNVIHQTITDDHWNYMSDKALSLDAEVVPYLLDHISQGAEDLTRLNLLNTAPLLYEAWANIDKWVNRKKYYPTNLSNIDKRWGTNLSAMM